MTGCYNMNPELKKYGRSFGCINGRDCIKLTEQYAIVQGNNEDVYHLVNYGKKTNEIMVTYTIKDDYIEEADNEKVSRLYAGFGRIAMTACTGLPVVMN